MRMSCNGCRVLRKGCSENCSIRPCLQWIKNPESQANATVFLAKFYGRAGLMNLINGGPDHLRPAIFRSLLYEACGRIVNPIYGSVGLLWSGSWQLCQAAVEAVLKGAPIMQIATEAAANAPAPLLNKASSYDIRHVSKDEAATAAAVAPHIRGVGSAAPVAAPGDLHKVNKASRPRFKRPGNHHGSGAAADSAKAVTWIDTHDAEPTAERDSNISWRPCYPLNFHHETSDDSAASQTSGPEGAAGEANAGANTRQGESRENGSMFSEDTPEGSMVTSHGPAEPGKAEDRAADDGEVELELTLGFEPVHNHPHPHHHSPRSSSSSSHSPAHSPARSAPLPACWSTSEICSVELALDLAA
ncbi:hypothetical protein Taro_003047 [Colocasia esculenta]|uniref:LOB domain-containing protein n=1 Tax=Colocasia esculenta TaxID=4460 RepID=A0A843TN52_COLES|nr:hypothetical protein [Colocasia esculenta]